MQSRNIERPTDHAERLRAAVVAKVGIIKRPEVEAATGLSRSSLYRLAAAGRFPRPLKIGPRASGWRSDELAHWLEQRTAERDGEGAQ